MTQNNGNPTFFIAFFLICVFVIDVIVKLDYCFLGRDLNLIHFRSEVLGYLPKVGIPLKFAKDIFLIVFSPFNAA